MDWFIEPFMLGFQQRALLGGLIAGLMTSMVGVWLVLRGMTFFGDAFVHAVLPGIAAAVVFNFSPYLGAAIAAVVMVAGVELIHRTTALGEDTGIGLLFVGMLALGVVIISKSDSYTGSLTSILFGDALGVSWDDIRSLAIFAVIAVAGSIILYRPLLALAFSRQKAQTLGMRPGLVHALLLVLIAFAIIGSFRSVGTMLAFGLLVGPPATAALLSRTIPQMFVLSALLSAVAVVTGLIISYRLGTAGSASMALVSVAMFFVVLAIKGLVGRAKRSVPRSITTASLASSGGAASSGSPSSPSDLSTAMPGSITPEPGATRHTVPEREVK